MKEDIIEVYNEMNSKVGDLADEYIVKHERITPDVVVETFSSGKKLYINYAETANTVGDVTIPALDYLVR